MNRSNPYQQTSFLAPVSIRKRKQTVIVSILRPLTTPWFTHLKKHLRNRNAIPPKKDLILDLSQVESISALGLHLLLDLQKKAHSHGRQMLLAAPPPEVRLFLDLTDLIPKDEIFASVDEALRRLSCEH
jgi:anti-anti-sigma factor